jgi:hypothetical protein
MMDYKFNENGVATAPNKHIVFEKKNKEMFSLLTAEKKGKWCAASEYVATQAFSGALPAFGKYRKVYASEKAALLGQIDILLDCPKFYFSDDIRKALKNYRNTLKHEQLTINF